MTDRLKKLRTGLRQEELDAILVSQAENRRYLSGFTGSAGFLIISQNEAILATDFRYIQQANAQVRDFDIITISGDLAQWFPDVVSSVDIKRIGVESSDISYSTYRQVAAAAQGTQIVPVGEIVEALRATKDKQEMDSIRKAVQISDEAFETVVHNLRPGMTEKETAWELEKAMRERGSERAPFDIIVASGPNSSIPHHQPTERALKAGEPVLVDIGACVNGYASDLSRTVCLGDKEDENFGKIYDLVLGAQLTAIATIEAGMSGELADSLAREVIEQGGHGDDFGHGLGIFAGS